MAQVITFENYLPAARYDGLPWTEADIEEGLTVTGPWVLLETIALAPLDADPAHPAYRDFTTELATDTPELWYRIVFKDATGDESQATTPVQNVESSDLATYATVIELFRILKIRTPSDEQTVAAERVLQAAAGEINSEIDLDDTTLSGWQLQLAAEVNLERAVEHWRQQEAPFGLLAVDGALGPAERTARDSWERHANKLAPLKAQWGIA